MAEQHHLLTDAAVQDPMPQPSPENGDVTDAGTLVNGVLHSTAWGSTAWDRHRASAREKYRAREEKLDGDWTSRPRPAPRRTTRPTAAGTAPPSSWSRTCISAAMVTIAVARSPSREGPQRVGTVGGNTCCPSTSSPPMKALDELGDDRDVECSSCSTSVRIRRSGRPTRGGWTTAAAATARGRSAMSSPSTAGSTPAPRPAGRPSRTDLSSTSGTTPLPAFGLSTGSPRIGSCP